MKIPAIFSNANLFSRIIILAGLMAISFLVISVPSIFIINAIFDGMKEPSDLVNGMKVMQIIQSVSLFVIPAFIMAALISIRPINFLKLDKNPGFLDFFLVLLSVFSLIPLMSYIIEWNIGLTLPEFLRPIEEWMRMKEEELAETTRLLLTADTWGGWVYNFFIAAFVAGVSEELFFRGLLQNMFSFKRRSAIPAILITAFIFSAIHLQFFGFFPRFLLGIYFGFLMVWSGSLLLPIFAHFLNNGIALLQLFITENQPELLFLTDEYRFPWWITILSLVVFSILTYIISNRNLFGRK